MKIKIHDYAKSKKLPSLIFIKELRKQHRTININLMTKVEYYELEKIYLTVTTDNILNYCQSNQLNPIVVIEVLHYLNNFASIDSNSEIPLVLLEFAKWYISSDYKSVERSIIKAHKQGIEITEFKTSFDIKELYLHKDLTIFKINNIHKRFCSFILNNSLPIDLIDKYTKYYYNESKSIRYDKSKMSNTKQKRAK